MSHVSFDKYTYEHIFINTRIKTYVYENFGKIFEIEICLRICLYIIVEINEWSSFSNRFEFHA